MSFRLHTNRNGQMLEERETGLSLAELARKYGLKRQTVKALLRTERHRRSFERPARMVENRA
jgi:Mor family transcriptional regulator